LFSIYIGKYNKIFQLMSIYTTKEAAKYLKISPQTLQGWYRKGKIQGSKPGGKNILFTKEQLDAVLTKKNDSRNWFNKLIRKNINAS